MGSLCVDADEISESIAHAWRYADIKRNRDAEACFHNAIRMDSSICSRVEYAEFLADCVSTDRAIEQLEISLNDARTNYCDDDRVTIFNRLAALYRELGNLTQARRYQQFAISADMNTVSANDSYPLCCPSTLGFALDLVQDKELTSAKSLLTSLSNGHDLIANQARISLASVYLQEKEPTAAHLLLDEATQWLTGSVEITQLIHTLELRSQAYAEQEEFVAAEESLNEAITLAENNARCSRFLPKLKTSRSKLTLKMSVLCQNAEWN